MGLWNKITSQLIDIIEWLDDSANTLVWRFPRYENEIKNGAKLIVREGQVCAFVREGQLADVFGPGTYTLETRNLPILSTLAGWKYGFNSPWKAEAYFVSTRTFTGYKWGTKNPIMVRDPEFGPVRLRAFGTFALKVSDPPVFLRQIVGTNSTFTVEGISDQLRDMMVARFADVIGTAKIAVLDIAGNQDELGKFVAERIAADFAAFGVAVVKLLVENVSLPPEVEQMLDKRTSMGILGDLNKYTQFQAATAIGDAAKNPGGFAGAGVGVGLGVGLGQQVAAAMSQPAQQPTITSPGVGAPPPLPQVSSYFVGAGGKQVGPFDLGTLQGMASRNEFTRDSLVWKTGMAAWSKAGEVGELAGLFASVPPPLPA